MSIVQRETRETRIRAEVRRGKGEGKCESGIPFLDHMMVILARYSGLDITITATGDLPHHTIEDVAISLGAAIEREIPAHARRYAQRTIPMDDALVECAIDAGGRPYYRGPIPSSLYEHWMRSFADNAHITLHLRVLRGRDRHHVVEAAFKALGLCLRDALAEGDAVFSTKGAVAMRAE